MHLSIAIACPSHSYEWLQDEPQQAEHVQHLQQSVQNVIKEHDSLQADLQVRGLAMYCWSPHPRCGLF